MVRQIDNDTVAYVGFLHWKSNTIAFLLSFVLVFINAL